MTDLWNANHPRNFWLCEPDLPEDAWLEAIIRALPVLELRDIIPDAGSFLELTLGEGQFGPERYQFGFARSMYYKVKPLLPRALTHLMRRMHNGMVEKASQTDWPIESRYARLQWEVLRQALIIIGKSEVDFRFFWPDGNQFAFVLTHDVETAAGQRAIPTLADTEESLGFRSSFNFVPERYKLDQGLLRDLRQRGFEIGLHGLKHDGKLFSSYSVFTKRASKINHYLHEFQAVGFRSPLTHRNPDWMQLLEIEYDLSFFDVDPYEPMPGGVMSIWPFQIGHFLELPYTLPQDGTLFNVFGEHTPDIWLKKLDFLAQYHGMALMLIHPDYSSTGIAFQCYKTMLREVQKREGYWHALPHEVALWWKRRTDRADKLVDVTFPITRAVLSGDKLEFRGIPLSEDLIVS